MKIETYQYPKSSFLSVEKDMSLITSYLLKNERLKKSLSGYYSKSAQPWCWMPPRECLFVGCWL